MNGSRVGPESNRSKTRDTTSAHSPKLNWPGIRDTTLSLPIYNSKHQIFNGSCRKVWADMALSWCSCRPALTHTLSLTTLRSIQVWRHQKHIGYRICGLSASNFMFYSKSIWDITFPRAVHTLLKQNSGSIKPKYLHFSCCLLAQSQSWWPQK